MLKSVHAFLSHLIDYAGMFPPAKLPLEEALRYYLQYRRTSPHAWMLGRFVCPTARLADAAQVATSADDAEFFITALGQPFAEVDGWLAHLDQEIALIQEFRRIWGNGSIVDMLEIALPKETTAERWAELWPAVQARLGVAKLRGFLEIPWPLVMDSQALVRGSPSALGLKVRCGGTSAEAFPTAAQIASFIVRCRDARLPWKATAGLHHPYGFWDASLKIWHHGFLNMFGAGLLAVRHRLSTTDVEAILADREGRYFRFEEASFAWRDWSCSLIHIAESRSHSALSFGSCSFTEPCEDLCTLELIDQTA